MEKVSKGLAIVVWPGFYSVLVPFVCGESVLPVHVTLKCVNNFCGFWYESKPKFSFTSGRILFSGARKKCFCPGNADYGSWHQLTCHIVLWFLEKKRDITLL